MVHAVRSVLEYGHDYTMNVFIPQCCWILASDWSEAQTVVPATTRTTPFY